MLYNDKLLEEINRYKTVSSVHELPASFHYITNTYLKYIFHQTLGVYSYTELILEYIKILKTTKHEHDIEILSLGSGNGDFEIDLAYNNHLGCKFTCLELNPAMIERGKENARSKGLIHNFTFIEADINVLYLNKTYDIIIANHSLHHFVELEHIFDEINKAMTDRSFFIINDMIGRNGHMFWDATFDICNRLWNILPKELKYNHLLNQYFPRRIQFDCSQEGFEGIRAQDILPLLDKKFKFKDFVPFFSLINRFIDRDFGHNYDINNPIHKSLLDFIWHFDVYCLENKILKPTQLIATLVKKNVTIDNYRFAYFINPKEIYELDERKYLNFFDENALLKKQQLTLDFTLNNLVHSGFYNPSDNYRFTDGNAEIEIDDISPGTIFELHLNYFIPEDLKKFIDKEPILLINQNIKPSDIRESNDSNFRKIYTFKVKKSMSINKINIISQSCVPSKILPNNKDIRNLGIAFIKLKIVVIDPS